MRVAILTHGGFPEHAKTGLGVLRYGDVEVAAVLDREHAGDRVTDHVPDVQDAPMVSEMGEVEGDLDALIVGVAPIGGGFDESWRPDVRAALERGCDVISGLHYFLSEDEEFAELAAEHDADIWDVRRTPDDLSVSEGTARDVDARVVLTVGTDCSTGKLTTTFALVEAARERGIDAGYVPTGQTGVIIEASERGMDDGHRGIVVDRTISDFTAGAVERMIRERAPEHDLLVVEGQGSITHPAYSGVTTSILHGAMADALVLCHEAGRQTIGSYDGFEIPPPGEYVRLYEDLAAPVAETEVVAGALNTTGLDTDDAERAVGEYANAIDAPATDPVRFGVDDILEAIR